MIILNHTRNIDLDFCPLAELRKMIDKAFTWADSKKKTRVNPIHGEPEAFLMLSETFEINVTDIEENEQEGHVEVEDWVVKHLM